MFAAPVFAQSDVPATLLAHLKTSRAFTLKVAEQMPEASYDFKLTPPQMSFAGQMVHLAQSFDEYLSAFSGQKASPKKPASMNKKDVVAFVGMSFDGAIAIGTHVVQGPAASGADPAKNLVMNFLGHRTPLLPGPSLRWLQLSPG